jgi:hypothetical protein
VLGDRSAEQQSIELFNLVLKRIFNSVQSRVRCLNVAIVDVNKFMLKIGIDSGISTTSVKTLSRFITNLRELCLAYAIATSVTASTHLDRS